MVGFDEQNWILPTMHNNDGIKNHVDCPEFKFLAAFFPTAVSFKDMHIWQTKCRFLYYWNILFCEIILLVILVRQVIVVCIICQYCQSLLLWNTINMLSVCGMDVSHEQ